MGQLDWKIAEYVFLLKVLISVVWSILGNMRSIEFVEEVGLEWKGRIV